MRCLIEREMISLSADIRCKPRWFEKMTRYKILKVEKKARDGGMTDDQINYVFNELVRYRRLRSSAGEPP